MWLITPQGFFSIVQKPTDRKNGTLTIRARVRSDLETLRDTVLPTLGPIRESKVNDYRFRAVAPSAGVAAAMSSMVANLDYSNVKSEVAKRQGAKREALYHDVWHTLYKLQLGGYEASPPQEKARAIPARWPIPKADAYGGVLVSPERRVLVREPRRHFGGYVWSWPKGTPDKGESPEEAALREVLEETGYRARIVGALPSAYRGTTASTTAFFLMVPEGKAGPFREDETIQVRWVSFAEAAELFKLNHTPAAQERDRRVLDDAYVALNQVMSGPE